ncbi:branched-chain amino acid ABC transporter substrate-binding protein [Glaciimonas sp. Gout2]|uniref:branched-chain amino acid ABC transporter substrate-binding protein n=1 Tax=unclassified Glaciimonas TaxID=2644401 RepID=UPI002AB46E8B|nr:MULTISPECIES: branched-chain amino acid ABC transporter substrate-binding protein [unclassified Glaciimonas]MDY7548936.1 branched-chain amino acid ABC transporter substrate-binding protein [Glaciimonas sp. CA11.2]MEB0013634.1 branched-chain amino acid ABC transporter substrate-binding protein [Glaciimonas sp. Cout2]MEB0083660.1 branched-chain amino acid ABC transporter substrate-binding protein [Glaciimonas sp. Gout2]
MENGKTGFKLIFILALLICCNPTFAANDTADTTLYVVAPFSGSLSNFGTQIRAGVTAAINHANASQKNRGHLTAEFIDDGCAADRAETIAKQLVEKKAEAVLGHVCSIASMPASVIYAEANIAMVSAASSNSALTERGLHNVFRVAGRDDEQAKLAAGFIAEKFAGKKIAIVQEGDLTGKGHGGRVLDALAKKGIKPERIFTLDGTEQISTIAADLVKSEIDVIFYGGHQAAELGELLKQTRAAQFKGQFISNDGAGNHSVWDASSGAAEGLLFTFDHDYRDEPSAREALVSLQAIGAEPDGFTLNAYASTQILIQALEKNRGRMGNNIVDYLHSHSFDTALGTVKFDSKGDLTEPHESLFIWRNGKAEQLR